MAPIYGYDAVDFTGRPCRGRSEAATPGALAHALERTGLVVLDVSAARESSHGAGSRSGRSRAVLKFTRACAALLSAGMPVSRALSTAALLTSARLQPVIESIRERVDRGASVADALAQHPAFFSPVYAGVVRASEKGSDLTGAFERLSRRLEAEEELRSKLISLSIYPVLLALAGGPALMVLIRFVLPRFAGPFGHRTLLNVNADGWLESVTNPNNETVALGYHAGGLLATFTDPRQKTYQFTYDDRGRLTRDDDPAGGFKTLARTETASGHVSSVTTALGRMTSYLLERTGDGRVQRSVTRPDGFTTTSATLPQDTVRMTTADGMVMSALSGSDPRFAAHIPLMKSLRITTPSGLTMTGSETREVTLSTPSNPLSLTSATNRLTVNGRTHTSVYNAALRQFTLTTPQARQAVTRIDIQGRVIEEQVTAITPFTYGYDSRGRLETIAQGPRTTTFTYDARGNLETVTDPFARTSSFYYDSIGRVTRQVLPGGREIFYAYDAAGNLTALTPPSRPAHGFAYTSVDFPSRYEPAALGSDSVATRYTYNLDRQLSSVVRPDGLGITLNYDTAGRIRSVALPTDSLVYAYSPTTGNLSGVAAPGGVAMSYTYDGALPKSVSWTGPVPGSVGVTYNANFEVIQQTVNGGHAVDFQYDNDGLLTATGAMTLTRSPQNGLLTGTSIGGVTSTQKYSAFGELDSLRYDFAGATQFRTGYTRDALGRITRRMETVLGTTTAYDYTYDTAGRLTEVRRDSVLVESYGYHANGNRTSFTDLSGTVTGTYDDQDRLLAYGDATYAYTTNGDLTSKTLPAGATTYEYDVVGNLRSVTLPGGTLIEYVVDGAGRRVGRKVDGVLQRGWLYSGRLSPVAELDAGGQVATRFVYGTRSNVPDYMVKDGQTYRIISDDIGSVRLVMNSATGVVAQELRYNAFGQITFDSNPGFQPFGFAGGMYDSDTRLTRFGARDYDAEPARWTAKDPIGFAGGSANLYEYAGNDPVNFIDPTGNYIDTAADVVFIGMDLWNIYNNLKRGCAIGGDVLALGGDAMGLMIPFLTGVGGMVRHIDNVGDAGRQFTTGRHIAKQMHRRGWTDQSIRELITKPTRTVSTRDTRHIPGGGRMDDAATAFIDEAGHYVVRNDVTGDIVQISNRNDPNWISPFK